MGGFFPISARVNVLDWLQQKATLNMAPATCRVEPRHITTFDNVTYSYNIPECEHVFDDGRNFDLPRSCACSKTIWTRNDFKSHCWKRPNSNWKQIPWYRNFGK